MRRLVDTRLADGLTESPLESDMLNLLKDRDMPMPKLQYEVWQWERFIARLDFAYPEQRVAIEVDGFRYHDGRQAFDADRARSNEIQAMGWLVLRITSKHLEEDPDGVVAWVRRALSRYS